MRLRRSDCAGPGYRRIRRGRGFIYQDHEGSRITDEYEVERIISLRIPPAWKDVWICPFPNGHLQATGLDDAGRRQYLYHPKFRERRDQEKFDRMLEFAKILPTVRLQVAQDLKRKRLDRRRVLATAVRLIDWGFFRIGSNRYADGNGTHGIATMKKTHVSISQGTLLFDFPAKRGIRRVQTIADRNITKTVAALKGRRSGSDRLLAYKDGDRWIDISSNDINAYIKEISGDDFSAKDFRTWHATVIAAVSLAIAVPAKSETSRKRVMRNAAGEVAHYMGNTPTVARSSYIDPRVFDRYSSGWTIRGVLDEIGEANSGEPTIHGSIEKAVIDLLEDNIQSSAVVRAA